MYSYMLMLLFNYVNVYLIAKILIRDPVPRWKEMLYIVFTGGFIMAISAILFEIAHISYVLIEASMTLFLFLFFYKGRKYFARKVILLLLVSVLISTVIARLLIIGINIIPLQEEGVLFLLLYALFLYGLSIISALLFLHATKNLRSVMRQNRHIQNTLLCIALSLGVIFQVSSHLMLQWGGTFDLLLISSIFFGLCVLIALITFFFYAKFLRAKYELQQKENEQRDLQYYISQIERQHAASRKFEHDYQNILASLSTFITEKDWDGLEHYFTTKIQVASEALEGKRFALAALANIKVREIKGILTAKLMQAQNVGIDVTFEADEEINEICIDSVTLVRMLGIILDNAMEAIAELGRGTLRVGCFKNQTGITFLVQNPCSSDMPKLHLLKQTGFTTKATGRGLGLNNLSELAASQPNTTLSTSIIDHTFIQQLSIGREEGM